MKTVVLCIDRDNDVGEKAGVKGPIIGRKDNLAAAMKLALADPEDSDLNTIFAAVKLHDEMKLEGRDVEVVTVLGDRGLGYKSDEKISHQIDVVVQVLKADSAVIVTDGAEDEFVLPLIESRLKILHVARVVVKQLPMGKETISIIRKYLQEDRFKIQILLPISLTMLTYAVFAALGVVDYFTIAFTAVLGGYFALNALNVGEALHNLGRQLRVGVATSRLTVSGAVIAAVILLLGALFTFEYILTGSFPWDLLGPRGRTPTDVPGMLVLFALLYTPIIYLALFVRLTFHIADFRLRRGKHSVGLAMRYFGYSSFFLIAFGVATMLAAIVGLPQGFGFSFGFVAILAGALLSVLSALIGRRVKGRLLGADELGV